MRVGEIASGAKYRMDEQFQNMLIVESSIIFQINSFIMIIFRVVKFWKFVNFPIKKIVKISNLEKKRIFNI